MYSRFSVKFSQLCLLYPLWHRRYGLAFDSLTRYSLKLHYFQLLQSYHVRYVVQPHTNRKIRERIFPLQTIVYVMYNSGAAAVELKSHQTYEIQLLLVSPLQLIFTKIKSIERFLQRRKNSSHYNVCASFFIIFNSNIRLIH